MDSDTAAEEDFEIGINSDIDLSDVDSVWEEEQEDPKENDIVSAEEELEDIALSHSQAWYESKTGSSKQLPSEVGSTTKLKKKCIRSKKTVKVLKKPKIREENQGRRIVMDLVQPFLDQGREVVVDNFFSSVDLAEKLLERKTYLTGTLRKNKREIPLAFLPSKSRKEHSSLIGHKKRLTLTSYVPKKHKAVLVLSSNPHIRGISFSEKHKPNIVLHYNASKAGVDTLDQVTRDTSCARITYRWPVRLFWDILDIALYNSYIIFITKYPDWNKNNSGRRTLFIKYASYFMVEDFVTQRFEKSVAGGIPLECQDDMHMLLQHIDEVRRNLPGYSQNAENDAQSSANPPENRISCAICSNRRKSTTLSCETCKQYYCQKHRWEKKIISCIKDCSSDRRTHAKKSRKTVCECGKRSTVTCVNCSLCICSIHRKTEVQYFCKNCYVA
ncbi:piggyBac transposable element-derived protein 4-like [Ochlerotatus camptorhynchus]|uniref:piggyBac transposable element-derived protein 4-like n=1 Tax=Ochlerotatus camptorhynchus TaxID=644619 RepID=UPI0031E3A5FB